MEKLKEIIALSGQSPKTLASTMMYKMPEIAYLIPESAHMPACIWVLDFIFQLRHLQKVYKEGPYIMQWFL